MAGGDSVRTAGCGINGPLSDAERGGEGYKEEGASGRTARARVHDVDEPVSP